MQVKINNFSGPINIELIDKFEEEYSIKLPGSYKSFLQKFNGGYPEPDTFYFNNGEDGSNVDYFLGLDLGEYYDLRTYMERYKSRIPQGFLPIAYDPGGNLVLIKHEGISAGAIYFWDHEFEADETQPDMSNISWITDNFTIFLNQLVNTIID